MLPALERRPATEAVARMEPEGCGLEGDGRRMAAEACLVARKTLRGVGGGERFGLMWDGGGGQLWVVWWIFEEGWGVRTYLKTFVRRTFMNVSASTSWRCWFVPTIPAFANITSSLPYVWMASAITALMASSSAASNFRAWMSTSG